ncbi:MAG: septum formation initiator family protein [Gammaproteobacteria bacterium]|nr:septum formation initiator family protein [Gammaproteobacteria bacterium]MCD8542160.1 septum formation initiator family protein [Gammaproteobacteria bacterium]
MNCIRRYFFIIILGVVFVLLQYEFWFSDGGLIQNHRLKERLHREKSVLMHQLKENEALRNKVIKIKKDPCELEAHARGELGMVKRGEEYIEIAIKPDES